MHCMGKLWEQFHCFGVNRQRSCHKLGPPLHLECKGVEFLSFKSKSETSVFQQGTAQPYFVLIKVCDAFKETNPQNLLLTEISVLIYVLHWYWFKTRPGIIKFNKKTHISIWKLSPFHLAPKGLIITQKWITLDFRSHEETPEKNSML